MTSESKEDLKHYIIDSLKSETEIQRIVLFGSFTSSDNPNDIDIAVFQDSDDDYLRLAMKYRRLTRHIARQIPLDIIPLKIGGFSSPFLEEIERGETVYER